MPPPFIHPLPAMPTSVVIVICAALWVLFRWAIPNKILERDEAGGTSGSLLACYVLASVFGPVTLGLLAGLAIEAMSSRPSDSQLVPGMLIGNSIVWLVFRWLIPSFSSKPGSRWMIASRLYGASAPFGAGMILGMQRDGMIVLEGDLSAVNESAGGPMAAITPLWALVVCVALWALFRWVLPRAALAQAKTLAPEQAGPAVGQLALWGALAMIFGSAALGLAFVYGAMYFLKLGSSESVAAAESLVMRLGWCSAVMRWLGNAWACLAGVVAAIFGCVYFYRLGKARVAAEASRRAEEAALLKRGVRKGGLENLPPTAEMESLQREAGEAVAARSQLVADGAAEKEIKSLDKKLKTLQDDLQRLDAERRRAPRLPGCGLRLTAPDTFWGRVGTFFISPGLESLMGRGTKAVASAVVLAVMAGAVGFPAASVKPALAERAAGAQLALDRLVFGGVPAAAENFEDALASLPRSEPLTKKEEAEAEELADEIGSAYEQQLAAHYGGGGTAAPEFKNEFKARAEAVRSQVMEDFAKRQGATARSSSSFDRRSDAFAEAVRDSVRPEKMKAKPVTAAGQEAAKHTSTAVKKGGRAGFQKTKAWWASFKMPTRPGTVGHAFAAAFASGVIDSSAVNDTRFQKPPDAELRQAMARGNEARAKQFAADIARGHFASAMESAIPPDPAKDPYHPPADMEAIRTRAAASTAANLRPQSVDLAEHFGLNTSGDKPGAHEPGSLSTRPEPHVKADAAVDRATERYVRSFGREAMADAHANFGDHFAGNPGDPQDSPRGKLLNQLSSEAALQIKSAEVSPKLGLREGAKFPVRALETPSAKSLAANATRARSFIKLRGFAKVGGVLIGREPSPALEPAPAITSFQWQITDGKKVLLQAADAAGKLVPHCPSEALDPDAVYAALVYAADGRPTAVTMVTADPLKELKILVHPALVDTRVGRAIVDLDRFVDQFAGTRDGESEEAEMDRALASTLVYHANDLYRVAWAARFAALSPYEDSATGLGEEFKIGREASAQFRKSAGFDDADHSRRDGPPPLAKAFPVWKKLLIEALTPPDTKNLARFTLGKKKASLTPLREKKEFFDQSLVSVIADLLPAAESLQAFSDAVRAHYAGKWPLPAPKPAAAPPPLPERRVSGRFRIPVLPKKPRIEPPAGFDEWAPAMLALPPTFEIWSGVRERSFTSSGGIPSLGLSSLLLAGSNVEFPSLSSLLNPPEFGPLEFMLQTAFTSPPRFGRAAAEGEEYCDEQPWEFPALRKWIADRVQAGVRADPRSREILQLSKDFTLAQRFFRLVLGGAYGEAFPLHELPALSRALEPLLSPPQRTPRWNAIRGQLEAELAATLRAYSKMPESKVFGSQSGLDQLLEKAEAHVKAEDDFRRACLKLLAAPDRDTAEWESRWAAAWDEAEARQQQFESSLAQGALRAGKLSLELQLKQEDVKEARGALDDDLADLIGRARGQDSVSEAALGALQGVADRVDHYAAAIDIRRALGVAFDDREKMRNFSREDVAESLRALEKERGEGGGSPRGQ